LCVCAYVCVCVRVRARVCARAPVCVCAHARLCAFVRRARAPALRIPPLLRVKEGITPDNVLRLWASHSPHKTLGHHSTAREQLLV